MDRSSHMDRTMRNPKKNSRQWRAALLLAATLPLLQAPSCALFDGNLTERAVSGLFLNPVAQSAFELFFDIGNSFAGADAVLE